MIGNEAPEHPPNIGMIAAGIAIIAALCKDFLKKYFLEFSFYYLIS